MISVPMKSSAPLTKQTILTINQKKVRGANNTRNILSINNESKSNSSGMPTTYANNTENNSATLATPSMSASMSVFKNVPQLINSIQKGQKVPLENNGKLSSIKACLGWNVTNANCDVDVSAFLLSSTGKVIGDSWFVFYGQESSPDGSTIFSIDEGNDREIVSVDFTKLNPSVAKIVFVLTINEALEKHLNFSMLKDAYIRIMDASDRELVSFKMDEYYANVTSMMIGELYQHNGIWKFNAIGNGVAKDLAGLCELYGVQVV